MALPNNFLTEPVPHEEAAGWIADKPAVSREVFNGLLPDLKARAFLITGIEDMNAVQEIRDIIAELPKGADWEASKKTITGKLSTWFGDDEEAIASANARAQLLLVTHGFQAYAVAQHRVMERQKDVFTYWMWKLGASRVHRPSHGALDGLIFSADSDFWKANAPPHGFGCKCRKIPILPEEADEIRAEDKGKPPESQRVVEGAALRALEKTNKLNRGPDKVYSLDEPSWHFDPSSLALSVPLLKERYDAPTWNEFETNAKRQKIDDGRTVWEWLNGKAVQTEGAEA